MDKVKIIDRPIFIDMSSSENGKDSELEAIQSEIKSSQKLLDEIIENLWDNERKKEVIHLSQKIDILINEYFKRTVKI